MDYSMSQQAKGKSRRPNFTEEEKVAAAAAIKEREDCLFGKFEGQGISKSSKNKSWVEVVDSVNAVGTDGIFRNVHEIKELFKRMKAATKQVESGNRKEMRKTGGGKADIKILSESQKLVLATIPETSISGIIGGIDLYDHGCNLHDDILVSPDLDGLDNASDNNTEEQQRASTINNAKIALLTPSVQAVSLQVTATSSAMIQRPTTISNPLITPRRRIHRKIIVGMSLTEQLLTQQVDLFKEQLVVLGDIKELLKDQNSIEREKLKLKRRKYNLEPE